MMDTLNGQWIRQLVEHFNQMADIKCAQFVISSAKTYRKNKWI